MSVRLTIFIFLRCAQHNGKARMPRRQEGIPARPVLVGTCKYSREAVHSPKWNLALEQIWLVLSLAALTSVSEKKPLKPSLGFGCCS